MNKRGIEMPFAGNRSRHLVTLMLAATVLLSGACKRKEASVSTAEANADFPPGCLETNPQPQIADETAGSFGHPIEGPDDQLAHMPWPFLQARLDDEPPRNTQGPNC